MESIGQCECGKVNVSVVADVNEADLNPRICDCDYCQGDTAAVISHPTMEIKINSKLSNLKIEQNGDRLAKFYRCPSCNDLIAVSSEIDGVMRGAVNSNLLTCNNLGEPVAISPKSLSSKEKIERWGTLWGVVIEKENV